MVSKVCLKAGDQRGQCSILGQERILNPGIGGAASQELRPLVEGPGSPWGHHREKTREIHLLPSISSHLPSPASPASSCGARRPTDGVHTGQPSRTQSGVGRTEYTCRMTPRAVQGPAVEPTLPPPCCEVRSTHLSIQRSTCWQKGSESHGKRAQDTLH